MNQASKLNKNHQAVLLVLLGLAIFVPVLLQSVSSLPSWLGGGVALIALFGGLLVFWRAGALRARYVALFAGALVLALVVGQFLGRT